jgi:starch phosphorylase
MAHLATVGSHSVNGVAQLHTDLVKSRAAAGFHELWPERFNNKTNGVTPRRWMLHANPRLTRCCPSRIGSAGSTSRARRACSAGRRRRRRFWTRSARQAANKRDVAALVRPRRRRAAADAMFVVQSQAHPRVQAPAARLPADHRALPALKRDPSAQRPRALPLRGQGGAGYAMAKLHIR